MYFAVIASKNLQKSSAIQNISVTLSSVIIAIFVCNYKYNRTGRLVLVEDASGGETYYYGRQGEVTKTVRTVMASVADIRTYVYGATYDSWNRVQTMTYPDGKVVTYHYNAAGQIR